mgnify:CR=1 FL=1
MYRHVCKYKLERSDGTGMSFETIRANDVINYIGHPDVLIIDLRNKEDYLKGHIPSAVNIPYENLKDEIISLKQKRLLILYCDRGNISLMAARDLAKYGCRVKSMYGGIRAYYGRLETGAY